LSYCGSIAAHPPHRDILLYTSEERRLLGRFHGGINDEYLLWSPNTLKMEAIYFNERRIQLEPHGVLPQKTFVIVTAMNISQKTEFFGPT
jgi:hypothetical protein